MGNTFEWEDFLRGANDGVNTVFFLTNTPDPPESCSIFRDGIRLKNGYDFTINAHAVTMFYPPQTYDVTIATYLYDA